MINQDSPAYTYFTNAYAKILVTFKETNKLKKVSYSIGNLRYCYKGRIRDGVLHVSLYKIYEDKK